MRKKYLNKITDETDKMELAINADKFKTWLDMGLFKLPKDKFEKKVININNCEITPMIMNKDIISKINVCFWLEELLKINRLQIADINCENIEELKISLLKNTEKLYMIFKKNESKNRTVNLIKNKINGINNNNFLQKFMADCYNSIIDNVVTIKSFQKHIKKCELEVPNTEPILKSNLVRKYQFTVNM